MRIVLDTNVVASALLWQGPPRQLLQAARDRRIELFSSVPLLAELTDILSRRKFASKVAASTFTVDELVDRYAALARVVRPAAMGRVAPDPDDDVVIGTALAARAELLVTGDRALLTVVEHEGVRVVAVEAARQLLGMA